MYDSVLLRALQKREELEEQGESFSNLVFSPGGCEITGRMNFERIEVVRDLPGISLIRGRRQDMPKETYFQGVSG